MTITFTIYEFAVLIVSIGFLIFIFTLIPALLQLKRTIKAVEDLAQEAKKTSGRVVGGFSQAATTLPQQPQGIEQKKQK
mgnify:CR=1 FL=1